MFSATKFVVAGAIVALFGGFLLAGVLTQPSDERIPAVGASASATTEAEQAEPTALAERPAGTFSSVESLAGAPSGSATLLPDGRVLVVGDTRAEVWDPATGSRSPAGSMGTSRPNHGAVGLADGRVLIVSEDEYPAFPSAEVWDPATASFTPAGSFSEWHSGLRPSLTLLQGGRVLVMGGGEHHMDATQVVEVWDPQTEAFRVAGEMIENRAEQSATLLQDGRVLIVGGEVEDPGEASRSPGEPRGCTVCETPAALAEIWDPETESFSPAGSLSEGRAGHTATLLQDGRVLIIGGGDTYDQETPSAEIWDPATETFSPAGSLHEERIFHTATLLPDGRVLVIGGSSTVGQKLVYPASAEIWDPATASFSPAGSLVRPRRWHSATLLPDGRVLVTGSGLDTEIWEPATDESRADSGATAAATPDLLPGVDLVTEEVEPGVYRVLGDGIRELSSIGRGNGPYGSDRLAIAPDGAVWIFARRSSADPELIRLGDQDSHPTPSTTWLELRVGPDGTLWANVDDGEGGLRRLDDDGWSEVALPGGVPAYTWGIAPDGVVWASGRGASMALLDATGWHEASIDLTPLEPELRQLLEGLGIRDEAVAFRQVRDIWIDRNGDVWAALFNIGTGQGILVRYDGETWSLVDPLGVGTYQTIVPPRVSADGTTWVHLVTGNPPDDECAPDHIHLARLDADGWTSFSGLDGVVPLLSSGDSRALLRVDHRGAVWVRPFVGSRGVRVFDGQTWRQYLDGLEVDDVEVAPDGNVWVLATDDLYVITPEAASPPISELMPGVNPATGEVEPGRYPC